MISPCILVTRQQCKLTLPAFTLRPTESLKPFTSVLLRELNSVALTADYVRTSRAGLSNLQQSGESV
jgi:hypothetical protein